MKVVWSLDGNIAIPVDSIKEFEIVDLKDGEYCVVASYCICTGKRENIFKSNDKNKCRNYIVNFDEMIE